jgi:hypothetical protein
VAAFEAYLRARRLTLPVEPEDVLELEQRARAHDVDREASLGALTEQESALPDGNEPAPAADPSKPGRIVTALSLAVLLPLALLVLLATLPFRARVRAATRRKDDRKRAAALTAFLAASDASDAAPEDMDRRFERGGRALDVGFRALAERDFDAVVRGVEAGRAEGRVSLATALHSRGIARQWLSLPRLAAQDRCRAIALGFALPARTRPTVLTTLTTTWVALKTFVSVAVDD